MSTNRHFPVLRVVLPAAEWTELPWLAFDDDSRCVAHGVAALASLPGHDELEIILPAKRVSAHLLSLPAQAGKHLDALIAQALEDRLLGDRTDVLSWPGPQTATRCAAAGLGVQPPLAGGRTDAVGRRRAEL